MFNLAGKRVWPEFETAPNNRSVLCVDRKEPAVDGAMLGTIGSACVSVSECVCRLFVDRAPMQSAQ